MILASYKGNRPGIRGLFNIATRWWLGGPYSHTELIFSDGVSGSSSWLDGGVRLKIIEYNETHWDFEEIEGDEVKARQWFVDHQGDKFDLLGLYGFVWRRGIQDARKSFCAEAIADALGFDEPFRIDPVIFPNIIRWSRKNGGQQKRG